MSANRQLFENTDSQTSFTDGASNGGVEIVASGGGASEHMNSKPNFKQAFLQSETDDEEMGKFS